MIACPLHRQDEIKVRLDQDIYLGVIEPVPIGEPVTWCHCMVVCPKMIGKPMRIVDLQVLNLHAAPERHHTQSPYHHARSVPHGTKKTIFSAWNDTSVLLHEDDRHLTKFITPLGGGGGEGVAATALPCKDILLPVMATHAATMRFWQTFQTKLCAPTTLSYDKYN